MKFGNGMVCVLLGWGSVESSGLLAEVGCALWPGSGWCEQARSMLMVQFDLDMCNESFISGLLVTTCCHLLFVCSKKHSSGGP